MPAACLLTVLAAELLLAAPLTPRSERPSLPIEVPIVGRPGNFNGAVGRKFEVSMRVSKDEVYVEKPLTLTVRVVALGLHRDPPERPRLDELPRFTERFHIDRTGTDKPDRVLSDQRAWEFDYVLRPLNDRVERIPPLPFVWYRPSRNPNLRGYFPTTFADEIDIKVKPKVLLTPAVKQVPIHAPPSLLAIATGPEVQGRDTLLVPTLVELALLLLVPPLAAGLWFVLWRRWYPDAAQRRARRQSRAAAEALRALDTLGPADRLRRIGSITNIAVYYLRQRFDLPSVEPTPAEVAGHLQRAGAAPELADKAAEFFRACDAARFAPVTALAETGIAAQADRDLAATAQHLINSLEAESWSRPC